MFTDDELLPISALQHILFCERQCALIHIEQAWLENIFTAEGRVMHERVHESGNELRDGIRTVRGLRLRSLQLGLVGIADVVEFHQSEKYKNGLPQPVEYKRGKPKPNECDKIQLCAQALCLEEMLNVHIDYGDIFYGKPRRRLKVPIDSELRKLCIETSARLHKLIDNGVIPTAQISKQCENCSLNSICIPDLSRRQNVESYLEGACK